MKFNMGCGRNHRAGYVNVDAAPESDPDEVCDLEQFPWPWPTGCASEVLFIHSLEHMGGDPKVFLAIMKELYRIAAPDCEVVIHVPHPRHDNFLSDPTHVRAITPGVLQLFDREKCDRWAAQGASNTPLAIYTNTDFVITRREVVLDEPFATMKAEGKLSDAALQEMLQTRNNIAAEYRIWLRARKPETRP